MNNTKITAIKIIIINFLAGAASMAILSTLIGGVTLLTNAQITKFWNGLIKW